MQIYTQAECHVNMKAETGVMPLRAREHLIVRKTSEASGRGLEHFSLRSWEGANTANTFSSDFQPTELWKKINFCCLSYPVCGTFWQAPWETNTVLATVIPCLWTK